MDLNWLRQLFDSQSANANSRYKTIAPEQQAPANSFDMKAVTDAIKKFKLPDTEAGIPTGEDFTAMSGIGEKFGPNANNPWDEKEIARIVDTLPKPRAAYEMSPMDQIGIAQEYLQPGLSQNPLGFLGLDLQQEQSPTRILANTANKPTAPAAKTEDNKPTPVTQAEAKDIFRKEDRIGSAQNALSTGDSEDEFAKAQRDAANMKALGQFGKAGARLSAAIAGVQNDPTVMDEFLKGVDDPIKRIMQSRQASAEKLQLEDAKRKFAFEKDKDDPNSVMSKLYRDTLQGFGDTVPAMKSVLEKIPANVSAAELERLSPTLFNLISAQVAREGRLETAKLMAAEKAEKREAQQKDDLFNKETKLRNEIKSVDKEVNYSQTKMAYDGLKQAFDEGRWGGLEDIQAIYGLIKALDPGSVVRESETGLVLSAEAPLVKFGNMPAKISRGDLASPSFRKKLLTAFGNLEKTRRKQFEFKTAGTRKAIDNYGLNADNILMQETGVTLNKETPQQNAASVVVREKATGRMRRVPESDAKQILADPRFEEVK